MYIQSRGRYDDIEVHRSRRQHHRSAGERQSTGSRAEDALLQRVYTELHKIARIAWRGVPSRDTLQPTALVHEAYLRLFSGDEPKWESRRHFFATAAIAMRNIVVDQARRHGALKRGGHVQRVPLTGQEALELPEQAAELLALEEAVDALAREHAEAAEVAMLHVYCGLSHEQMAEILGLSKVTARRRWAFARTWIKRHLMSEDR